MALDETTRQVNRRAVRALEAALHWLGEAHGDLHLGVEPLADLSRVTNAHDPALENLQNLAVKVREAREDLARRLAAESEGE